MKTHLPRYISIVGLLLFLIACSTKKNSFVSRNSHALSSKYNILYNGGLALDQGIIDLKTQYQDNFWERLPIERMQIAKDAVLPGATSEINPSFERAETKSTKAIQKHSMNIGGSEKNPQMDEAHLMLGQARYYDQRYIPALEAFNYILYKYPNSDKIYEAKVWREKTNIRLDNDALAANNLRKLLSEIKFKDQIFADANAILSQAYLNLELKDSALVRLKLARDFTEEDEEKARYYFIIGQLYEELGYKDSAYASYQSVIDMNRKAARQYVIHAHARQAMQFDYAKGDTIAFLKNFNDLLKDRENRPFLDVLNHQLAVYYDKNKNYGQAEKFYNVSLKKRTVDQYLAASNYRNLADIHFNRAKYVLAGKYYDSTLVQLNPRLREFKAIKRKRENLVDVIKYEGIATRNDSIVNVYKMSGPDRIGYYDAYIVRLKKEEEIKKALAEKEALRAAENGEEVGGKGEERPTKQLTSSGREINPEAVAEKRPAIQPPSANPPGANPSGGVSNFYFYNAATVAYGKTEFRKNWGDRTLKNNWRISADKSNAENTDDEKSVNDTAEEGNAKADSGEKYTTDFYIKQLPTSQTQIDSIAKERNFAYYQLGVIYKEKFREYQLAADKLEKLLVNNPEERLILPSMYNLFKIYEITDKDKAVAMKARIIREYPDSRYAQILGNPSAALASTDTPAAAYGKLYKLYESGDYKIVVVDLDIAIDQYTGDDIVPKLELLKASTIGKLKGIGEYKKALNYVSLSYPNSEEGRQAEALLGKEVPIMENLTFNGAPHGNWKILYKAVENPNDKSTKALQDKIKKFIKDRSMDKLSTSLDIYTMDKNFVVVHGMRNEEHAKGIASVLKEFKEYKVMDVAYIISSNNYKVVQIKKNFDEFLKIGNQPYVPPAVTEVAPPVKSSAPAPVKGETLEEKIARERASREKPAKDAVSQPDAPQKGDQQTTQPQTQSQFPPSQSQFPPSQMTPPKGQPVPPRSQTAPPRK